MFVGFVCFVCLSFLIFLFFFFFLFFLVGFCLGIFRVCRFKKVLLLLLLLFFVFCCCFFLLLLLLLICRCDTATFLPYTQTQTDIHTCIYNGSIGAGHIVTGHYRVDYSQKIRLNHCATSNGGRRVNDQRDIRKNLCIYAMTDRPR